MSEPAGHHEVFVPLRGRDWITSNQRLFWVTRAKRTREWREATAWHARAEKVPYLPQGALIVCQLLFSTKHIRDPANWAPTAKACVDGLVDADVFDDDNHRYVTGPDMRIGPVVLAGERGVRLLIYPKET